MELERQENILIIGHQASIRGLSSHPVLTLFQQAILRCLSVCSHGHTNAFSLTGVSSLYSYGYFHDLPQVDLPYINFPLHTVIKLTPKAYGCDEERYARKIPGVRSHADD